MVRENRIKEKRFNAFSVNGSVLSPVYGSAINGEILRISFTNITSPGSIWVAESGTDIEFFRRNNVTSGLSSFDVYPAAFTVSSTNVTGSPDNMVNQVTSSPIYIAASGLTSGANTTFGPIVVQYR